MKRKNENGNAVIVVVVIVILVLAIVGIGFLGLSQMDQEKNAMAKNIVNNTIVEDKTENRLSRDEKTENFLTSYEEGQALSTSYMVPAGCPELYYFLPDGTFAYFKAENPVTEADRMISCRGTWRIENKKLILRVTQQEDAEGGQMVSDAVIGEHLEDYIAEIKEVNYESSFTMKELKSAQDSEYNKDSLDLDVITLYKLSIGDSDDVKTIKTLAEKGYDVYKAKQMVEDGQTIDFTKYVGQWYDDYGTGTPEVYDEITIQEVNGNTISFDFGIYRVTSLSNLTATIDGTNTASFQRSGLEDGIDIEGTLKFEEDKVVLEITKSEWENIKVGTKVTCTNHK